MFTQVTVMLEKALSSMVPEYIGEIYHQFPLSPLSNIDIILQTTFRIVCQSQPEYWHKVCLFWYRLQPKKAVNMVEQERKSTGQWKECVA
jgi:hypothetical protein